MNFGDIDWVGLCILILGIGLVLLGCFMVARALGVVVVGLFLMLGALISSRSRVG